MFPPLGSVLSRVLGAGASADGKLFAAPDGGRGVFIADTSTCPPTMPDVPLSELAYSMVVDGTD